MTNLLAVDPGVAYHAQAWFGPELYRVDLVKNSAPVVCPPYTLVIERPQVYRTGKARVSDIVSLAIATGRIAARVRAAEEFWYLPADWKGQIKKPAHHRRIRARLGPAELALLDGRPQKELVHILDAVGLGLYHLGRL